MAYNPMPSEKLANFSDGIFLSSYHRHSHIGDGGFQVNVRNHTDLKGGIITSSAKAETDGQNRFQTATLSRSDLQNHSRYDAEGFGIGVSGSISGQSLGQT
ncbi:hypothetical protein EGK75_13820, partial [Neisseria weixii]